MQKILLPFSACDGLMMSIVQEKIKKGRNSSLRYVDSKNYAPSKNHLVK